jgi:hypothetical protein
MHWGPWTDVAVVIGIVSGTIAIVAGVWSAIRWAARRLRPRTVTQAVESPHRAVEPPAQVIQAPVVIPSAQTPRDGGAASTTPGPGSTTGSSIFETMPGRSRPVASYLAASNPLTTVTFGPGREWCMNVVRQPTPSGE